MGRAPCCEKVGLNRGSWTTDEDKRLVDYILKYGHGNWRALPKQAGLLRCGKSCRLRWINYLRPDIKRGNFTGEEEETIIKLHRLMGNKWSKIASYLPGRTDNEIKNVWNTHLKKRLHLSKEQTKKPQPTQEPANSVPSSLSSSLSGFDQRQGEVNKEEDEHKDTHNADMDSWDDILANSFPTCDLELDTTNKVTQSSSPSSLSSSEYSSCYNVEVDILEDIPDIPIEPGLLDDDLEMAPTDKEQHATILEMSRQEGDDEGRRWLAELEEELDSWVGSEGGGGGGGGDGLEPFELDPWVGDDVVGDPVSSYFQMRPPSPSIQHLFDTGHYWDI